MRVRNKKEERKTIAECLLWGAVFTIAGDGAGLFFAEWETMMGLTIAMAGTFAWGVSGKWRVAAWGVTSVACFFFGAHLAGEAIHASHSSPLLEHAIVGEGVVIDDVSAGAFSTRVPVKIVVCAGATGCAGERLAIETNRFRAVAFGDRVAFSCTPKKVENFSPEFDFRMYLAAKRIRATCEDKNLRVVSGSETLLGYLGRLRGNLEANVNRFVDEPMASLGNGLLFGGSNRLSDALAEDFAATSMTHITAVSGYNITLVATVMLSLGIAAGLWRRGATVAACVGIFFFVLMVGSPSSGVRAGAMGAIVLWAMAFGRTDAALRALAYAGAILVIANPLALRYDIGFALSFLATLGIVVFSPWYERVRPEGTISRMFGDIAYATVSAQMLVVPVLLATFGLFSFASFLANVLVLWTLPWAMIAVCATATLGGIFSFAGFASGVFAQAILWYDIEMIRWCARAQIPMLSVREFGAAAFLVWYGLVAAIATGIYRREAKRCRALCRKTRFEK